MNKEINQYIKHWESNCYLNGLPDEAPSEIKHLVPSYKNIAMSILRNDISIIGFARKKSEYYNSILYYCSGAI